jgi:hypothetical protein
MAKISVLIRTLPSGEKSANGPGAPSCGAGVGLAFQVETAGAFE